jgi:large subunit ribosomal protein L4
VQTSLRNVYAGQTAFRPAVVSRKSLICQASVLKSVPVPIISFDGADKGTEALAVRVAEESARGLVHRYLVMVQQNARRGTASTLTRSEVRGGGKKPYAQKGTGNARRGSSVSPLFVGGGVIFGPKPKDWSIKMNKKERRLALATALQSAAADVTVVESLEGKVSDKKTKSLIALLAKVGVSLEKKTLLITKAYNESVFLAGRNIEKLAINTADKISVFDVLNSDKIIIESEALKHVNAFYGESSDEQSAIKEPASASA